MKASLPEPYQVQKGGVLYASEARQMVKMRKLVEVQKAEKQLHKAQNAKKRLIQQYPNLFSTR